MLIAAVKLKNWLASRRITFRVYLPTALPSIQSTISRGRIPKTDLSQVLYFTSIA